VTEPTAIAERAPWEEPGGATRRVRAVGRGEDGAALVIALTMIAVVAVVLVSILSYTGTSLRAAAAVRTDRQRFFAADGAVEAAIQNLRNDPDLGYTDKPTCDFSMPVQGDQPAASVSCTPQSPEIRSGGQGETGADQPLYSILTLGRAANQNPDLNTDAFNFWDFDTWIQWGGKGEQGIYNRPIFESLAGTATLKGGVFSNSNIVSNRGTLLIQPGTGTFKSRQTCNAVKGGVITPGCTVVGYPAADGGYADDGQGVDPRYPSRIDLQGVPAKQTVPTCPAGSALVAFEPGWYDDAAALSNLTRDCKGPDGKGADFWFKPGLYYFDFRNAGNVTCTDGSRPHQWCVGYGASNPRVVGGTPLGPEGGVWDPNPGTRTVSTALTPASSQTGSGFSSADNAKAIDGSEASATQSCAWLVFWMCDGAPTVTLAGYPQIPSTATLSSVTLRVNHRESSDKATRTVTVLPGGGGSCTFNPAYRAGATTDSFVVPLACLGTPAKLNGMQIRYSVNRTDQNGTAFKAYLDGFAVDVTYTDSAPERFRFPQGCDNTRPGVQFVFGGDSGMRAVDGTLNLCSGPAPAAKPGQPGYTRQQIAVYGIPPLPALRASAASTNGSPRISDVDNAKVLFENPTNKYAGLSYSGDWTKQSTVQSDPLTLTFPGLATQGQPGGYPSFPALTRVKKVELRANYSTVDNWTDWFGDPSPLFRVKTPEPGGGMRNCGDNTTLRPTFALFDPNTWGGYSQDFADVTNCFRTNPADPASAVDVSRLKNFQVDWVARDDCGLFACSYTDQLDGIELYVTLEPTSTSAQTWLPGSDCIVGLPNYAGGGGDRPNCPVMKWNSGGPSFSPDDPSVMTSIIGTFYAPGDVLDFGEYGPYCTQTRKRWILFWRVNTCDGWVNDWDGLSYPVVDRGIIARQLTIRGLKVDPDYHDPIIGCGPGTCGGTIRSPRLVYLTAAVEGRTRVTSWVCFGPVESTGPASASRVPIGTTGKYCTGDGSGPPRVVRWNAV